MSGGEGPSVELLRSHKLPACGLKRFHHKLAACGYFRGTSGTVIPAAGSYPIGRIWVAAGVGDFGTSGIGSLGSSGTGGFFGAGVSTALAGGIGLAVPGAGPGGTGAV